jgi:hypothetical protein
MENPVSKLALDHWYKVLMAGGLFVFLLAGAGMLKNLPTLTTATIALGVFFIGMGEWINHPLQTKLMPASLLSPGGVITGHPRAAKPIGVFFDLCGFTLVAFGAYKLFQ